MFTCLPPDHSGLHSVVITECPALCFWEMAPVQQNTETWPRVLRYLVATPGISGGARLAPWGLQGISGWPRVTLPLPLLQVPGLQGTVDRASYLMSLSPPPAPLSPIGTFQCSNSMRWSLQGRQGCPAAKASCLVSICPSSCGLSPASSGFSTPSPGFPPLVPGVCRAGTNPALSPLLLTCPKYSATGIRFGKCFTNRVTWETIFIPPMKA